MSYGGGVDVLAWSGAILSASATVLENASYWLRFRGDIALNSADSLFLQHTRTSEEFSANQGTNIRYYRNITAGTSGSLYWRNTRADYSGPWRDDTLKSDAQGASFSTRLMSGATLTANTEYQHSANRKGLSSDASLTTRHNWRRRDADIRLSAYDRPATTAAVAIRVSLSA